MTNHDGYEIIESSDISPQEKRKIWDVAIGLNAVDNLYPSAYLKNLVEQSAQNQISYQKVEDELRKYYAKQDTGKPEISSTFECDIVSTRIAHLLEDNTFVFSPVYLKTIHAQLFEGVWQNTLRDYAGRFRDYNITKTEPILNGRSVVYGDYANILEYLKYDFDDEKQFNYTVVSAEQKIQRLAKFTSAIWQVHPFGEGNTRTTAVFIEKYLRNMGFSVNNELFAENAKYFRDALVLSNYANIKEEIQPGFQFLLAFFDRLFLHAHTQLPTILPIQAQPLARMQDRMSAAQSQAAAQAQDLPERRYSAEPER